MFFRKKKCRIYAVCGVSQTPIVYSIQEVADLLGISKSYAYELARKGIFPVLELGTKRVIPKEKFNSLIFKDNYINGKLAIVLPHPSPLNIKWFKEHPEFMNKRIFEIRKIINKILN